MNDFNNLNENRNAEENNSREESRESVPHQHYDSPDNGVSFSDNQNGYGNQFQREPMKPIKPVRNKINITVIVCMVMIYVAVCTLAIFFIFSDIRKGSVKFNERVSEESGDFSLEIHSKPDSVKNNITHIDDDEKYTMEELAEYICPQIVEIFSCVSSSNNAPISSGSGIIISEDGYIVTNTHILDQSTFGSDGSEIKADKFVVVTNDDKEYIAEIVGRDKKTDIAVVKINASGLPCAEFGDSDEITVGEEVAAVGNPEGFRASITNGIVSGVDRQIKTDYSEYVMSCIQTNAAISPGNSGGALVNMYGQVIGITSSKYITSTSEGLGFAIAINDAKPIIDDIISKGYVDGRVRVGISFYSTNDMRALAEIEEELGTKLPKELMGILITEISDECDISNTELQVGDFILLVNGRPVQGLDDLNEAIEGKKAGDTIIARCARTDEDMNISYFDIEFKLMKDTSGDF